MAATPVKRRKTIALKKILVPTDFSEASLQGIRQSLAIAREFKAKIDLVHVVPATVPAEFSHLGVIIEEKRLAAEARKGLQRFARETIPSELRAGTHLLGGGVPASIVQLAAKLNTDLIVTATHGHSGWKHFWIGSVAERVVRHAPCPVLTVHEDEGKGLSFGRILVPIDFSRHSQKAIEYATAFAKYGHGKITLLHVIEPPSYPEYGYARIPVKERRMKQEAERKLAVLCASISKAGISCESRVRSGPAYDEIRLHADKSKTSLIVLGSHGRSGLARAIFGSTAERVVRHAATPVLVVRQGEHDFVAKSLRRRKL